MDIDLVLKILVLLVGFYMAWNIGANDVSNAMGTSVGSRALTMRQAVIIAAIFEFSGAFLLGGNVSETIQGGIIDVAKYAGENRTLILGMCGALLGTGIWLQLASYFGLPVSTTHAIIGAILGFGVLTIGFSGIEWGTLSSIALSWVISPLLSGIVSYFIFTSLQRQILFAKNPRAATIFYIPVLLFFVFVTFSLTFLLNGFGRLAIHFSIFQTIGISLGVGAAASLIGWLSVRHLNVAPTMYESSRLLPQTLLNLQKSLKLSKKTRTEERIEPPFPTARVLDPTSEYQFVEKAFGYMQIISACFVAFAHGANDVANAIAPVASVLNALKSGFYIQTGPIPSWLLAFGGLGIVVGLATWGWRVIETIGRKITELTPTRGFCAEFGAAITILVASKLGMPISTTHCLVGAVLGVGFARGIRALNLRTLREIVLSWIITVPASALMSILCFLALRALFS